ncbi:MAG: pilus assembly protein [Chloroflexota bacterium]|nr:MAG: pilus assembly protein [Chloroflexota bacterium]HDD61803.1 pilus assembly protein [Chloroflexota bacterium]
MYKDAGQGLVEYSLILLFIALAIILILSIFGTELADVYSNIIENIP